MVHKRELSGFWDWHHGTEKEYKRNDEMMLCMASLGMSG